MKESEVIVHDDGTVAVSTWFQPASGDPINDVSALFPEEAEALRKFFTDDALGYIDMTINGVVDMEPGLIWRNDEVLEMLREVRSKLVTPAALVSPVSEQPTPLDPEPWEYYEGMPERSARAERRAGFWNPRPGFEQDKEKYQ